MAAKLAEAQLGSARQPAATSTPADPPQPRDADQVSQADRPSDRSSGAVSSSQSDADGHVSDADSDGIEEIPQANMRTEAARPGPTAGGLMQGMPPGIDPGEMHRMMQDPAMMQQINGVMSNMDPAQLESMAKMAGAPGALTCCHWLSDACPMPCLGHLLHYGQAGLLSTAGPAAILGNLLPLSGVQHEYDHICFAGIAQHNALSLCKL